MALVLGLKEGESFYVDDKKVLVEEVKSAHSFVLTVPEEWATKKFEINASSRCEVLPNVFCSAGSSQIASQVRVLIEAPKNIKLLRQKHYEANNADQS